MISALKSSPAGPRKWTPTKLSVLSTKMQCGKHSGGSLHWWFDPHKFGKLPRGNNIEGENEWTRGRRMERDSDREAHIKALCGAGKISPRNPEKG